MATIAQELQDTLTQPVDIAVPESESTAPPAPAEQELTLQDIIGSETLMSLGAQAGDVVRDGELMAGLGGCRCCERDQFKIGWRCETHRSGCCIVAGVVLLESILVNTVIYIGCHKHIELTTQVYRQIKRDGSRVAIERLGNPDHPSVRTVEYLVL